MRSIGARGLYTYIYYNICIYCMQRWWMHACVPWNRICIHRIDMPTNTLAVAQNRFYAKENWDSIWCRYTLRAVLAEHISLLAANEFYKCIELFEKKKKRKSASVWVANGCKHARIPTTVCDVTIKCKPLKCVRLALMDSYWNSNVLYIFFFLFALFFSKFPSPFYHDFSLTANCYYRTMCACVCVSTAQHIKQDKQEFVAEQKPFRSSTRLYFLFLFFFS